MKFPSRWLIEWPQRVAGYLSWLAPLFARVTVGWAFLWSGWGKLHNLPQVIENFNSWGIPYPHLLTPFVSGVQFFGGLFLLLGFLTRISAGALGITMMVGTGRFHTPRPEAPRGRFPRAATGTVASGRSRSPSESPSEPPSGPVRVLRSVRELQRPLDCLESRLLA